MSKYITRVEASLVEEGENYHKLSPVTVVGTGNSETESQENAGEAMEIATRANKADSVMLHTAVTRKVRK